MVYIYFDAIACTKLFGERSRVETTRSGLQFLVCCVFSACIAVLLGLLIVIS